MDLSASPPAQPERTSAAPAAASATEPGTAASFIYRPIWDIRLNMIPGFRCSPVGSQVSRDNEDEVAALDFAVMAHVLENLRDLNRDGRRLLLSLPVHFTTLARTRRRLAYATELQSGLSGKKSLFLIAELVSVPMGVPKSRIIEVTTPLTRLCRAVAARLPLETSDFAAFSGAHIALIGCHIGRHRDEEHKTMAQLNRFSAGVQRAGLGSFVGGIFSVSLLAAAVGAGFRFLDGDCVAKPLDKPGPVVRFELADVYGKLSAGPRRDPAPG